MDKNEKHEEELTEKSFTWELLEELKRQSHRWMIAFCIILVLWFVTIGGFLVYMNQYDFQTYDQDGSYNNINTGTQGDVNNGTSETKTTDEKKPQDSQRNGN